MGRKKNTRRFWNWKQPTTKLYNQENGQQAEQEAAQEHVNNQQGYKFFACYLLTSLSSRFKGHTYIGYTVNPRRRIRQHNGEIVCGASETKTKRPWEMVFCIYGFPTEVAALQFEWAWQNPRESLAAKEAAASFKRISGLASKIKLAYTMLTLPTWQSLDLTVNFFSSKYQKYTCGCPTLPKHMRTQVFSVDDVMLVSHNMAIHDDDWDGDEGECDVNFQEPIAEEISMEASEPVGDSQRTSPLRDEYLAEAIEEQNYEVQSSNDYSSFATTRSTSVATGKSTMESTGVQTLLSRNFLVSPVDKDQDLSLEYLVEQHNEAKFNYYFNDSPPRRYSSFATQSYGGKDAWIDEQFSEQPTNVSGNDKDQDLLIQGPVSRVNGHGIEVIDVSTPSPCSARKSVCKRRKPNIYPEIIDLTNSPLVV